MINYYEKKKSTTFKVIITILIILLVLIVAAAIFVFTKLHSLNNSINESLDRDHSQLRQKAAKRRPYDGCALRYR